tara:strand:- start:3063 stop:3263 length:201 start_codon:yes stop_codon:yes gene_type:complete
MFNDLKTAWQQLLKNSTLISDGPERDRAIVQVPNRYVDAFQKEFNLCFIEPDEDIEFQLWQDNDRA